MTSSKKRQIITTLTFAGLLLALLAASVGSLQLQAGVNFVLQPGEEEQVLPPDGDLMASGYRLLQRLLVLVLIVFAVNLLINLFDREGGKQLLRQLLLIALVFFAVVWFAENQPYQQLEVETVEQAPAPETPEDEPETFETTPVSFTPEERPWLFPALLVGLALFTALLAFLVLSMFRNRPAAPPQMPFDQLAATAQQALEEIQEAREEFANVIYRCYFEMAQAVKTKSGLIRSQEMTPHEFGALLLKKGFPSRPVMELTTLFERARYGGQREWDQERQTAVRSLAEVVEYCRGRS